MFFLGLLVMGMSITGLIALAFVQNRFPQILEALEMSPADKEKATQDENALAEGLADGANLELQSDGTGTPQPFPGSEQAQPKEATQQADPSQTNSAAEVENIDIDEVPVNSVNMTDLTSARQIK